MIRELLVRLGTFFILIGLGIFILFVASDSAGQTNFDYLFWAMLCVVAGIFLRRNRDPAPPSGRFGLFRRSQDQDHDRRGHR
jgi:hypothetical protein